MGQISELPAENRPARRSGPTASGLAENGHLGGAGYPKGAREARISERKKKNLSKTKKASGSRANLQVSGVQEVLIRPYSLRDNSRSKMFKKNCN
jgi:hypothetical protein